MAVNQQLLQQLKGKSADEQSKIIQGMGYDASSAQTLIQQNTPQSLGQKVENFLPTIGSIALPTLADIATGGLALPADMLLSGLGASGGEAAKEELQGQSLNPEAIGLQGLLGAAAPVVGKAVGAVASPVLEKLGLGGILSGAEKTASGAIDETGGQTVVREATQAAKGDELSVMDRFKNAAAGKWWNNTSNVMRTATDEDAWLTQAHVLNIWDKGQSAINTGNSAMNVISGVEDKVLGTLDKAGVTIPYNTIDATGNVIGGVEKVIDDSISSSDYLSEKDVSSLKGQIEKVLKPQTAKDATDIMEKDLTLTDANKAITDLGQKASKEWDSYVGSNRTDQSSLDKFNIYNNVVKSLKGDLTQASSEAYTTLKPFSNPEVQKALLDATKSPGAVKMMETAQNGGQSEVTNAKSFFQNLKKVGIDEISNKTPEGKAALQKLRLSPFMLLRLGLIGGGLTYASLGKNPALGGALIGGAIAGPSIMNALIPYLGKDVVQALSSKGTEGIVEKGAQGLAVQSGQGPIQGVSNQVNQPQTSDQSGQLIQPLPQVEQYQQNTNQINQMGQQLLANDMQNTGGRNRAAIASYISTLKQFYPDLTASQQTKADNYNNAVDNLNQINQQFQSIGAKGLVGGALGAITNYTANSNYNTSIAGLAGPIAKLLEGSDSATAITAITNQLPKITDTDTEAKSKLQSLVKQINDYGEQLAATFPAS